MCASVFAFFLLNMSLGISVMMMCEVVICTFLLLYIMQIFQCLTMHSNLDGHH